MENPALVSRDAIAQSEQLTRGCAAVGLCMRHFAHAGIEKPCALRGGVLIVGRMSRSEVAIGKTIRENGFSLAAVQFKAFRLLVLFVPIEAQPAQAFEDGLHAGFGVA